MSDFLSLRDFIDRQISGDWGKEVADNKHNTEVFCIRGADLNAVNEGNYSNLPIRYVETKSKGKFLNEGNIIIEVSGGSPTQSTGRVSYVRGDYMNLICSNFCRAYEIKDEHSPKYFYYLVKNIYNSGIFFNFESKTTGIKNLLLDAAFDNIKVPKVTLKTQKSIAKVLSDLDTKIEINSKIIQELEAMAKTLYDYWFVQFDFPDERGMPYKSSSGKMAYNAVLKREIPEGWDVVPIETMANIIDPHPSHRAPKKVNKGFPFAGIGDIDAYGNIDISKARVIGEDFVLKQENDYIINNTSLGYGRVGTVGKVVRLRKQNFRYALSPTMAIINPKSKSISPYVYFLVNDSTFYKEAIKRTSGTTRPAIGIMELRKIPVVTTLQNSNSLILKFCEIVNKNFEQIENLNIQSQQLKELRDWLLPMLMNGQVTVGEVSEKLDMAAEPNTEYEN